MERKIIFLTKAFLPEFEEYINEIKDMWDTHWITTMGPKHNVLENELQKYMGVDNVSVFVNGHSALKLLANAMKLTGEVITTPYTFISTTHAIVQNGLTPVFCDVNKDDFNIDVDKIEALITDNTSAIIAVHVYGNPCDVEAIDKIAKKHNLKVIYDAAHAFGEKVNGKDISEYGDASIFSFHASKVYNSIEGGCAVYKDEGIKDELLKLRNFGIGNRDVEYVGINAKMNEFAAAMGICNLRHIDEIIQCRKELTECYINRLDKIEGIQVMAKLDSELVRRNYSYMPILVNEDVFGLSREELLKKMNDLGIQALSNFYPITNRFSCYKNIYGDAETPNAIWLSEHILLLPLNTELTIDEVNYICDTVINLKENS